MKKTGKFQLFSNVWRVAGLLLVLVLFTSHFSLNIAARFVNKGSGENGATVGRFNVSANCVYDETNQTYLITITNHSEVTVSYGLANSSLSNGVTLIDGAGVLAPGETRTHTLSFEENYTQMHGDIAVDILRIEQVN